MRRYIVIALLFVASVVGLAKVFDGPNPPPTCDPIVGCQDPRTNPPAAR